MWRIRRNRAKTPARLVSLFQQYHLAPLAEFAGAKFIPIDSAGQSSCGGNPGNPVQSGGLFFVHEFEDGFAQQIRYFELYVCRLEQAIFESGGWVEGIGVILPQFEFRHCGLRVFRHLADQVVAQKKKSGFAVGHHNEITVDGHPMGKARGVEESHFLRRGGV